MEMLLGELLQHHGGACGGGGRMGGEGDRPSSSIATTPCLLNMDVMALRLLEAALYIDPTTKVAAPAGPRARSMA
jgi:hypothetical protein